MTPFFRNIRHKLANDNQFLKYSRYAIGEIILVVIGILIALQINNWNEERKEKIIEKEALREIKNNLFGDRREIESDIAIMDSIDVAGKLIIDQLKNSPVPSSAFRYNMLKVRTNPHFDPNMSGYNLLLSKGLEVISNDSLRESISVLYESNYAYYLKYENERVLLRLQAMDPVFAKSFSIAWNPDLFFHGTTEISQVDYEALRKDTSFLKILKLWMFTNKEVQDRAIRTKGVIENLIEKIENELNLKSKVSTRESPLDL